MTSENTITETQAQTFVNKKGPAYVINDASPCEIKHFEGSLYNNGIPNLALISYFSSPTTSY